ncbi:Hypothetical protein CINCED_3A003763 [Cinara cedri]|uniref:Uncharacterized protein n=1 Tax=Cinara cedri TaxID=506608 RepID=A0A5E4NE29_9HEMI|nr:Hypothetical protein CINCED_3A003763 [Cinara cedri]
MQWSISIWTVMVIAIVIRNAQMLNWNKLPPYGTWTWKKVTLTTSSTIELPNGDMELSDEVAELSDEVSELSDKVIKIENQNSDFLFRDMEWRGLVKAVNGKCPTNMVYSKVTDDCFPWVYGPDISDIIPNKINCSKGYAPDYEEGKCVEIETLSSEEYTSSDEYD